MFEQIRSLLELIRVSHTIFALPFALLAAVMAWTTATPDGGAIEFRVSSLLGILLAMFFARSASMALNRIADRKIDAANPRTAKRHLAAGILSLGSVVTFTIVCCAAFVGSTLLFLPNRLPLYLSVPVLLFLLGYSYTKRFTALAHFWLGTALMLAPVSVWIALRGEIVLSEPLDIGPAVGLGLGVFLWVAGFDIIYACQDADFDVQARLHSVPSKFGVPTALRIAAVCHFAMVAVLASLPWAFPQLHLGWIYGAGVAAVAALLAYEHTLVRPDDLARVNTAFFHVNSIVSFGLFVVGSLDLLL